MNPKESKQRFASTCLLRKNCSPINRVNWSFSYCTYLVWQGAGPYQTAHQLSTANFPKHLHASSSTPRRKKRTRGVCGYWIKQNLFPSMPINLTCTQMTPHGKSPNPSASIHKVWRGTYNLPCYFLSLNLPAQKTVQTWSLSLETIYMGPTRHEEPFTVSHPPKYHNFQPPKHTGHRLTKPRSHIPEFEFDVVNTCICHKTGHTK